MLFTMMFGYAMIHLEPEAAGGVRGSSYHPAMWISMAIRGCGMRRKRSVRIGLLQ